MACDAAHLVTECASGRGRASWPARLFVGEVGTSNARRVLATVVREFAPPDETAEVISGEPGHPGRFGQAEGFGTKGPERLLEFDRGELPEPRAIGVAVLREEGGAFPPARWQLAGYPGRQAVRCRVHILVVPRTGSTRVGWRARNSWPDSWWSGRWEANFNRDGGI